MSGGFPVVYQGQTWRTTEHLFQAMRFEDEGIKTAIQNEKSPLAAKIVAKKNAEKMVVKPCSDQDLENMKQCLRLKVQQHPELAEMLLETQNEIIVEDVTKRGVKGNNLFWGMANVEGEWVGKNILGNMWAELRQELMIEVNP